jgi:hypothetical protein
MASMSNWTAPRGYPLGGNLVQSLLTAAAQAPGVPFPSQEAMMPGPGLTDAGMPVPGIYFQWGDFLIQFGNLMVIAIMVVLFILALVLPFPRGKSRK